MTIRDKLQKIANRENVGYDYTVEAIEEAIVLWDELWELVQTDDWSGFDAWNERIEELLAQWKKVPVAPEVQ